jgi:hypothetical protein
VAADETDKPDRAEGPPPSASGASGATGGSGPTGAEGGAHTPDEEELRAQLEEEIRKVKVDDVVLQSAVSILNLSARRIAKEDERDLDQAKVGIDAARALTELVPEEARPQLRQAVSELQLLYAKQAGEGEEGGGETPGEQPGESAEGGGKKGDSPLWTPGS